MQKIIVAVVAVLVGAVLWSCGTPNPSKHDSGEGHLDVNFNGEVPAALVQVLQQADQLELISIVPNPPTKAAREDPNNMHGYPILGRALLTDRSARLELLSEFARGCAENDGMVAACFDPRHVIRAQHEGRICDLVICFECLSFQIYDEKGHAGNGDLSESPRPYFDRVFQAQGLSLAPRH